MRARIRPRPARGSGAPASRGFTLLEVLIAIALLGLAIVPLLGTFSQSLRMAESSKRLTQATLIAREMMTLMELEPFPELEETVREVRLQILWDEGTVERSYEVIDFVVRE